MLKAVGDRSIYRLAVKVGDKEYRGFCECKTKKEAEAKIDSSVKESIGDVEYEVVELVKLKEDDVVDEVEEDVK